VHAGTPKITTAQHIVSVLTNTAKNHVKIGHFVITIRPADSELTMRDAVARSLHEQYGIAPPPTISQAVNPSGFANPSTPVRNPSGAVFQLSSPQQFTPPQQQMLPQFQGAQSPGQGAPVVSASQVQELLYLCRGMKRSLEARGLWVEPTQPPDQGCTQQ